MKKALAFLLIVLTAQLGVAQPATKAKPADKAKLVALEKEYKLTKAAYLSNLSNAKAKSRYIATTNTFAMATMTSPALGAKEKYPRALQLYREVQRVDPKNAEAKRWITQIEGIYKSMNRPVPKS